MPAWRAQRSEPTEHEASSPAPFLARWGALLLVVLTCLAYAPSVRNGFIWDDDQYVQEQVTLRTLDGLRRIWIEAQAIPQYYPVTFTSLWIDHQLWELNPVGYHIENILQHAASAVLLWRILALLGLRAGWWAAAVFALHPVHVESVEWITERKNTLSGIFYLATLFVYLRFAFSASGWLRRAGLYALALAFFVLALFSKTVTATLPAIVLLLLWWRKERVGWRDFVAIAPFFVVGAVLAWVTTLMETFHVGAMGSDFEQSFVERCLIAGRVVWFYAGKLLWPYPLIFSYPRWTIDVHVWWQHLFPVAALIVLIQLWVARARLGKGPLVAALFFVVSLIPVLGFFNVYPMRFSFVADHFQYLASIGPIAAGAETAVVLVDRLAPIVRLRAIRVACVYLTLLGALTWRQTLIYRDAETVWYDTLARNPASWLAHNNLAVIAERRGQLEEAKKHYQATLKLWGGDARSHHDVGTVLAAQGEYLQAIVYFESAVRLEPSYAEAHNNLGNALNAAGQFAAAERAYREAIRLKPDYAYAHGNLAGALAAQGKAKDALAALEDALRIDPKYVEAHYNLASMFEGAGRAEAAEKHYAEALRLRPEYSAAHERLAMLLMRRGDRSRALEHMREALRLEPGNTTVQRELDLLERIAETGDR